MIYIFRGKTKMTNEYMREKERIIKKKRDIIFVN